MSIHCAGYDDCPCNNSLIPCISAIVSGPKQHTREKWSLYEADHIVCGYMKGKCHGRCTLRRQGTLACSHTCIFLKASARVSLGSPLYPFGTPFPLLDCALLEALCSGLLAAGRLLPRLPCCCTSLRTSSAAVRAASCTAPASGSGVCSSHSAADYRTSDLCYLPSLINLNCQSRFQYSMVLMSILNAIEMLQGGDGKGCGSICAFFCTLQPTTVHIHTCSICFWDCGTPVLTCGEAIVCGWSSSWPLLQRCLQRSSCSAEL